MYEQLFIALRINYGNYSISNTLFWFDDISQLFHYVLFKKKKK